MLLWLQYTYFIYTATTINTPLLASPLDAGVRGHPDVKELTDHKPRNARPGRLAEELARTHNHKIFHIYIYIDRNLSFDTSVEQCSIS